MDATKRVDKATLKTEIMLQINQKLLERGVISRETYETAIARIFSIRHPEV